MVAAMSDLMAVVEIACTCPVSSVVRSVVSIALICEALSAETWVVLRAWTSVVDSARMAVLVRLAICRVDRDVTIDMKGLPLGGATRTPNTSRSAWMTLQPKPCARLAQLSDEHESGWRRGGLMPGSHDSSPSAAPRLAAES